MSASKGLISNNRLVPGGGSDYGLTLSGSNMLCMSNINLTTPSNLYRSTTSLITHYQAIKLSDGTNTVFEADKYGNVDISDDRTIGADTHTELSANLIWSGSDWVSKVAGSIVSVIAAADNNSAKILIQDSGITGAGQSFSPTHGIIFEAEDATTLSIYPLPNPGTANLGTASRRWNNLYGGEVNLTGDIICADIACGALGSNHITVDNIDLNVNTIMFTGNGYVYSAGTLYLNTSSNYISGNNLTIAETVSSKNLSVTNSISASSLTAGSFTIDNITINGSTVESSSHLRLYTGNNVYFRNANNYIDSNDDLYIGGGGAFAGDLYACGLNLSGNLWVRGNYTALVFNGNLGYSGQRLVLAAGTNGYIYVNDGYLYLRSDRNYIDTNNDLYIARNAVLGGSITTNYLYYPGQIDIRAGGSAVLFCYNDTGSRPTSVQIYDGGAGQGLVASFGSAGTTFSKDLLPSGTIDIGSAGSKFANLYLSGDAVVSTNVIANGNVIADGNVTNNCAGYVGVSDYNAEDTYTPTRYTRIGAANGGPSTSTGSVPIGAMYVRYSTSPPKLYVKYRGVHGNSQDWAAVELNK